jgi:hypothetical protein
MDSRDLLILGGVAVAGYFGYQWWASRAITKASTDAPGTDAGRSASSMTDDAARSTVFGGATLAKRMLAPIRTLIAVPPSVTGPPQAPPVNETLRTSVLRAVLGPVPVAPSPNNLRFASSDGTPAVMSEMPKGSQPQPGDPVPTFYALKGIG